MNKHRVDCRSGWKCNAFPKFLNITPTVKQAEAKHRTGIALPKQNLAHHASASRMIRKKQHSHLELFVGENDKEEEQKHEHQHCLHMWCLFIFASMLSFHVFCHISHLLLVRWRGACRRSLSLRRLWNTTDAAHSLRDWTQRAVNHWGRLLGFGLSCSIHCEEKERGRRGGSSDVWMQRAWTLKSHLIGHLI